MNDNEIILQGEDLDKLIDEGLQEIADKHPTNHTTIDIVEVCNPGDLHRSEYTVTFKSLL